MEKDGPVVAVKLRHCSCLAPVDKHVAVRQDLGVALGASGQTIRSRERADFCNRAIAMVELDDSGAGERADPELRSNAGSIVKEGNPLDGAVLRARQQPSIVLERKAHISRHREVGAMAAAKLPDDVACRAVDLENGGVVACGDQIVSVGVFVDAVDVEVIPCVG